MTIGKVIPITKVQLSDLPSKKRVFLQLGLPPAIKSVEGAIKRGKRWYALLKGSNDQEDWIEVPLKRIGKIRYFSFKRKNYLAYQ